MIACVRVHERAGHCKGKVHQHDTLAIGGRRVLVSRDWSGKSLADHRYDQLAWVRKLLKLDGNGDEDQALDDETVQAAREQAAAARRLGHSNANVTTRHYARPVDERDGQVAEHLDRDHGKLVRPRGPGTDSVRARKIKKG
jgi:hypothetical protein